MVVESQINAEMGVGEISIEAELYKVLIYDPGAFFLPHRDTEKSPRMFGTLVVVLPSEHTGGELVIRHESREVALSLVNSEGSSIRYAAFYADCEHQVKEVSGGNRICLVYNLVRPQGSLGMHHDGGGDQRHLLPAFAGSTQKIIEEIAAELPKFLESKQKLAWVLSHYYTPNELSPASLKNEDLLLTRVLGQAAELAGCLVSLGILHLVHFERDDNVSWKKLDVDLLTSLQGVPRNLGQLAVLEEELAPVLWLKTAKPDEDIAGDTGNEGVLNAKFYHYACLLVWLKDDTFKVVDQNGFARATQFIEDHVNKQGGSNKENRADVVRLLGQITPRRDTPVKEIEATTKLLADLGEPGVLYSFLEKFIEVTDKLEAIRLGRPHLDTPAMVDLVARQTARSFRQKYYYTEDNSEKIMGLMKEVLEWEDADCKARALQAIPREVLRQTRRACNEKNTMELRMGWGVVEAINDEALWGLFTEILLAPGVDPRLTIYPLLLRLRRKAGSLANPHELPLWIKIAEAVLADSENPPHPILGVNIRQGSEVGQYCVSSGAESKEHSMAEPFIRDRGIMNTLVALRPLGPHPSVGGLMKRLKVSLGQWTFPIDKGNRW